MSNNLEALEFYKLSKDKANASNNGSLSTLITKYTSNNNNQPSDNNSSSGNLTSLFSQRKSNNDQQSAMKVNLLEQNMKLLNNFTHSPNDPHILSQKFKQQNLLSFINKDNNMTTNSTTSNVTNTATSMATKALLIQEKRSLDDDDERNSSEKKHKKSTDDEMNLNEKKPKKTEGNMTSITNNRSLPLVEKLSLTHEEKITLLKEKLALKSNSNQLGNSNISEKLVLSNEDIKKIAEQHKKQTKQMLLQHKRKLKEEEENRFKFLAESNNIITDDPLLQSTNLIKQRRNPITLIKYLLSYNYSSNNSKPLETTRVPDEFKSYDQYKRIFEPLILNEFIAKINTSIDYLINNHKMCKYVKCLMKINATNENINTSNNNNTIDDVLYVDLKYKSDEENLIISKSREYNKEIFDITFANNYLLILSSNKTLSRVKINNNKIKQNDFNIIGFLNSNEHIKNYEYQRIQIILDINKLPIKMKNEWIECYVYPIEKISTFIREYASLNCLESTDMLRYILSPKFVSNIQSYENTGLFTRLFSYLERVYNPSQLHAIKKICMSNDGISLLQGPPGTGKTHTLIGIVSGLFHYIKNSKITCKKHILICAPSNTAIDEIIIRIVKYGLFDENGTILRPNIVRIGVLDKNPHEIIKAHSLESLAEQELNKTKTFDSFKDERTIIELKEQLFKITKTIERLKKNQTDNKQELQILCDKRREIYTNYQNCKIMKSAQKEKYKELLDKILLGADIICSTLSSSGTEKLEKFKDYIEAVIVDEASQCIEPTNIIPLQYSPKRLILIGDPKQLPATTFSLDIKNTLFDRSLFERIIDNGVQAYFLNEQYRMTANIRKFPSLTFYQDRLLDGKNVKERKFPAYLNDFTSKNLFFIDIKFSKEILEEHSYYNKEEAILATMIMEGFVNRVQAIKINNIIGCISPYKKQVLYISELLRSKNFSFDKYIEVNTVDAFQGKEKDIIIFSAVRSSNTQDVFKDNYIGFLNDLRRLNVALTRPKFILYVIGNAQTLSTNKIWNEYIKFTSQNRSYLALNKMEDMDKITQVLFKGGDFPIEFKLYKTNKTYHHHHHQHQQQLQNDVKDKTNNSMKDVFIKNNLNEDIEEGELSISIKENDENNEKSELENKGKFNFGIFKKRDESMQNEVKPKMKRQLKKDEDDEIFNNEFLEIIPNKKLKTEKPRPKFNALAGLINPLPLSPINDKKAPDVIVISPTMSSNPPKELFSLSGGLESLISKKPSSERSKKEDPLFLHILD